MKTLCISMPCSLGLLGVIGFDSLWHCQGFLITLLDDSPVTLAVLGGDRYFATAAYHSARCRVSRLVRLVLVAPCNDPQDGSGINRYIDNMLSRKGNQNPFTDLIPLDIITTNQIDSDPDDKYEI